MRVAGRAWRAGMIALAGWIGPSIAGWSAAHAEWLNLCDRQAKVSASQQDKLFRFGAIIKAELARSGHQAALIARSGLDLQRFGIRYSHAGVSLQGSDNAPWSVRQLYYACDERKPRVYDQGISGFLLGTDNPDVGYISVVLLPEAQAGALARTALDPRQALSVLGATYSANAYPFSTRYQNCNQWLIELLATAWGPLDLAEDKDREKEREREREKGEGEANAAPSDAAVEARRRAQSWLQSHAYAPTDIEVSPWLMWARPFVPFVHSDDHPQADLDAGRFHVSMPAAIEAFAHQAVPQATRVEFCHTPDHVVIHRGWRALADGCVPGDEDEVIRLD